MDCVILNVNFPAVAQVQTIVQNVKMLKMENIVCLNALKRNMIKMVFVYFVTKHVWDVPVQGILSVQMVVYHVKKQLSAKE